MPPGIPDPTPSVSLELAYIGKAQDRVQPGTLGVGGDGALDGTLVATLHCPCGRTITRLRLQSSAPGTWDTDLDTSAWLLGAARTLDGVLLNDATTMAVNFAIGDGESFVVFAADYAGIEFVAGTTLTLIVTFSDGTTVSGTTMAAAVPDAVSIILTYNGKLRDRVRVGNVGIHADGVPDATLTVTLKNAIGGRTVTQLRLLSKFEGWDTDAATGAWLLGAARTLDSALLNDPATMAVNFDVADGDSFVVFAADRATPEFRDLSFAPGTILTLTVTFSDGTTVSATTVARRL